MPQQGQPPAGKPSPAPEPPAAFPLRSHRTAMLVIHGIGEQNPYETLDAFARGVFGYLADKLRLNVALSPLLLALKDWTQVGMRITVSPGQGPGREGIVDLFEYYWAPQTEDKLSWKNTLKWLILTDLTPLRYFADNLQEMITAQRKIPAFGSSLKLYAREVLRVLFLYVPLGAGVLWLFSWISHPVAAWSGLQPARDLLRPYLTWPKLLGLTPYVLAVLMAGFMLQSLGEYFRRRLQTIQKQAELWWFALAAATAAAFLAMGNLMPSRYSIDLRPLLTGIFSRPVLVPLALLAGAAFWRYVLTAYVADVAVYVTADAKSKSYAARSAILKDSTAALKRILESEDYDRVILAGHSLGSVIAYDTLNELLSQFNAAPGPPDDRPASSLTLAQLQKMRGLLTFGSPLDKIYYFFRQHVKENQAIRAQILSMLYSFRKVPSGRDYGRFRFTYSFPQLDGLVWLNAYSPLDPVSAKLKFYRLPDDDQKRFWYWIPGLAHLSYWGDADFYAFFCGRLL